MENVPSGQVQTVLGPVDPSTLGITLTHEHLIIDLTQVLPHMLTVPGVKNVPDIYSDTPGIAVDAEVVPIPFTESYNANTREVSDAKK